MHKLYIAAHNEKKLDEVLFFLAEDLEHASILLEETNMIFRTKFFVYGTIESISCLGAKIDITNIGWN